MKPPIPEPHPSRGRGGRAGLSSWVALTSIGGVAVVIVLAAIQFLPGLSKDDVGAEFITAEVTRGPFVHEVWERGELESSSNIEVRCEVKSNNSAGVNIIEIVPEGTEVQEGDFLVKLDDSALQTQLIQQQIVTSNSESEVQDAKAALEAAKLELLEYEEGTFVQEEEKVQSEVFVAEENLRRAEEYYGYSQKMSQRGYVSQVQLEADRFAVEKARKELEVAKTGLKVLRSYTKSKQLTLLNASIKTAEGRLKAKTKTWELDKLRLEEIKDQISKCTLTAPAAGQVVYANDPNRRGSNGDILIAEGRPVRERQVIIRLPDQNKMSVIAKVHESRINHLNPGMPATVTLDAYPDEKLHGTVSAIGEYPLPTFNIYMSHIKEYEVFVEIDTTLPHLRPGMSAEVNVLVDSFNDVLQVPIHAVIERADRYFCAIPAGDGTFETREIEIGPVNDESIIVESNLEAGEIVALNFPGLDSMLDLPQEVEPGEEDLQASAE